MKTAQHLVDVNCKVHSDVDKKLEWDRQQFKDQPIFWVKEFDFWFMTDKTFMQSHLQRIGIFSDHLRSVTLASLWSVDLGAPRDDRDTCLEVKLQRQEILDTETWGSESGADRLLAVWEWPAAFSTPAFLTRGNIYHKEFS